MSEPGIEVSNIGMIYPGGVEALKGVGLKIPPGELTTLLGPSGCGKTTLLKIISGLIKPVDGEVLVHGERISGPGPERALVFQDFALLPWATVMRNVAFGLELRGMSKAKRQDIAQNYIEEVGLAGFENSYPHELSGGMRQRCGLARALTVNAEFLLMDEPFSAVDEQMRRKLQEDLLALLKIEKKTVVFVTHSIEEAVYLSDQIALMTRRPGNIQNVVRTGIDRSGDPESIRRDPIYLDTVEEIWSTLKQYLD